VPQHLSNSRAQIKLGRMRITGLFAALLLAWVSTARAASFDCAKASSAVEKTICADPALSKADDRMAEVFAAASGATLRPSALRADQLRWLGERNKLVDPAALQKSYQQRIEELGTIARKWQTTAVAITAEQARHDCLVPPDAPYDVRCRVDEFGDVRGVPSLRYQLQSYKDGDLRVAGGTAVFKVAGPTLVPIVDVAIDTAHFAPPQVVQSPAGRLLVVRGHIEGTGNFSADQVYLHGESRLIEVDTTSWLNELPPPGCPRDGVPGKVSTPTTQASWPRRHCGRRATATAVPRPDGPLSSSASRTIG
jgi:uncharacterized protein YecT (DUF1311 family)